MEQILAPLPLIMAKGSFKRLDSLSDEEIENFLSYLVRFTANRFSTDPSELPNWWTENVLFPPLFYQGSVPLPHTRNKHVKMRHLVKLCYTFYNCTDLLALSEKLASLHVFSYKLDKNEDQTVTVYHMCSKTPIVILPVSNLDYDLVRHMDITPTQKIEPLNSPSLTVVKLRKTLIPISGKTGAKKSTSDDETNCIVIEDSSSDDEVEIVSYEPGALPPTPPRNQRLIRINKPGPACSKVQPNYKLTVPLPKVIPFNCKPILSNRVVAVSNHKLVRTCRVNRKSVDNSPSLKRTLPKKKQTLIHVDLTLDDDFKVENDVKSERLPTLSKDEFLSSFSLIKKGKQVDQHIKNESSPTHHKVLKRFCLKKMCIGQVPYLVQMGILPKRTMCTLQELVRRNKFIEKYTRGGPELSSIVVDVRDKAAVAKIVKNCYVKLKRLRRSKRKIMIFH